MSRTDIREALRPFAEIDFTRIDENHGWLAVDIQISDIKRARTALSSDAGDGSALSPRDEPSDEQEAEPAHRGPWRACHNGECKCGQIWSVPFDAPIAVVQHGPWGDSYPALRTVDASEGMSGTGLKVEAYMERIEYGSIGEDVAIGIRRLIAAAPELLAALQDLHADCVEYARINNLHNDDGKPGSNHAMRRAAAIIAKATQPVASRGKATPHPS